MVLRRISGILHLGSLPPWEAGRMRLGRVVGPDPFGLGFRWTGRVSAARLGWDIIMKIATQGFGDGDSLL